MKRNVRTKRNRVKLIQNNSYGNWQNLLTASVHNKTSVTPALKLQHSKGSLQREAAELSSTIRINDDKYAIASKEVHAASTPSSEDKRAIENHRGVSQDLDSDAQHFQNLNQLDSAAG